MHKLHMYIYRYINISIHYYPRTNHYERVLALPKTSFSRPQQHKIVIPPAAGKCKLRWSEKSFDEIYS